MNGADVLERRRSVTVVLRLVVDDQGRLIHGDIIDVENRTRGRFPSWGNLIRLLRQYVATDPTNAADSTPSR